MSKRKAIRERRQRKQLRNKLIWSAVGLAGLAVLGFMIWNVVKPAAGEAVPVMGTDHIEEGTLPAGGYNSEPPTSGPHYANPLNAGFYSEAQAEAIPDPPDGYLIHSLEHGYVIFWYNCQVLAEDDCEQLKADIQSVMDSFNGVELIAFPREGLEHPVVMTSWGRLQRFDEFDRGEARRFIRRNRNRAPEASAG